MEDGQKIKPGPNGAARPSRVVAVTDMKDGVAHVWCEGGVLHLWPLAWQPRGGLVCEDPEAPGRKVAVIQI